MNFVQKPTLLFGVAACIMLSFFLLSCARTSNSQQGETASLEGVLKVLDVSVKDTVSVRIEFTLKNMSSDNLEILKWGTPFEGEFTDNMFDVKLDGSQIRYIGMQVKRGAPQKEDYVIIGPHGDLSATLLLEKGYELKGAGRYSVRYSKPYVSVRVNNGEAQLMPVHSNQVVFTVAK